MTYRRKLHKDSATTYIVMEPKRKPEPPPREIPVERLPSSRPDSSRYLLHRRLFPEALPVTSCFDLSGLDEAGRMRYRDLIHLSAEKQPGDYVNGCMRLPRDREKARAFYATAGFSAECVDILTSHLSADPEDDVMDEEPGEEKEDE